MRCSKGGSDNREGRKFCVQCGQALNTKMSSLAQAVYPRAVWPRRPKQIPAEDDWALRSGARTREIDRRH
jgi:uncharacterized membrane protein YvbJ